MWLKKAENDLKTAERLLKMKDSDFIDAVCYHAQQSAEKHIKAYLIAKRINFPKSHDLTELVAKLPAKDRAEFSKIDIHELNPYAVEVRYPGGWEPISFESAVQAIKITKAIKATTLTKLDH